MDVKAKALKNVLASRLKKKAPVKPSAAVPAKARSEDVKEAQAGRDMGSPGKAFQKIASKASAKYGSKAAGDKVAGAIFWKKMGKKA